MSSILLLAAALLGGGLDDGPFADLSVEAARAKAVEEEKLLLIDFTAVWCGPCQRMEKETWVDAGVLGWLADNAVSIQVDVDEQQDVARRFEIEAMPTIVALRDGEEFDRSVGYKDAAGFLAWAKDVRAGKRSVDAVLERAKALRDSDDIDARYDLARDLLRHRQYELALEQYLWLWPATRGTSFSGVRVSFMLGDIQRLVAAHEPARKAFLEILDELGQQVAAAEVPSFDVWKDWSALCTRLFDEDDRLLAWYEARRDEEGRLFSSVADDPSV